ncbi:hypothetical protein VC83_04541 [Pseudogymnoascus destructans]|uniref:VOC domain-containing protein n=2 Tax=Pseudogymnoascus destructans TaxID=655981 RepID=L8G546_PSED2|nr:uncharacterized protein VC83_04541 [Pseudogymnoascus destructans]ELR08242.1 hypothetical protein GMDG_03044 [Pseudogymnoascus destructans 20631-21]OAF57320.1 hypothetical protein VC83_04541 [Pseudogymnoascus destructans]
MIPTIEVSHLPSSSSFYAAVTQPLGIHFLCASPSSPHSLHFGIPAQPSEILFTLTESHSPRPSTLTLTASNFTQVANFHALALESNTLHSTNLIQHSADTAVAKTTDHDGNMLEVCYARSPLRRGSVHAAPTTITTASTAKEARRVLDWQRDVARSISSHPPTQSRVGSPQRAMVLAQPAQQEPAPSQVAPSPEPDSRPALLRSATMTAMYNEVSAALPERIGEGLSAQAIIGTILGAAAGAAVAYAMVRSEEPEQPRPQLVTYFSAPAPQVPQQAPVMEVARSKGPSVGGSRVGSERSLGGQRYVLRYNVASAAGTGRGGGREGVLQPVDERRSMSYSAYDGGRSQAPAPSHASTAKQSRYSERGVGHGKPVAVVSASGHSEAGRHSESGRSHASRKSDSTIKPARTSSKARTERHGGQTVVSMKSDRKSTTVSERARRVPLPESAVGNMAPSEQARRVPLPESVAGSVAPSDSISNIGMRSHYSRRNVY